MKLINIMPTEKEEDFIYLLQFSLEIFQYEANVAINLRM